MTIHSPRFRLAAFSVVIGLVAVAAFVFFWPSQTSVTVRLLVVPRSDAAQAGQDARVLAEIVRSSDFFTKVAAQDPQVSWADFGDKDADRRARWRKTMRSEADEKTGFLTLIVRDRDTDLAGRIAQAAADVLTRRGGEYLAGNPQVMLVDPPL